MPLYNLTVNGKSVEVDVASNTPMLWVLRDHLKLVDTKYGCGYVVSGLWSSFFTWLYH